MKRRRYTSRLLLVFPTGSFQDSASWDVAGRGVKYRWKRQEQNVSIAAITKRVENMMMMF